MPSTQKKKPPPKSTSDLDARQLARRAARTLTVSEVQHLRACTYDRSGTDMGKLAGPKELERRGLLESDPQAPTYYRTTSLGEYVLDIIGRK